MKKGERIAFVCFEGLDAPLAGTIDKVHDMQTGALYEVTSDQGGSYTIPKRFILGRVR